MSVSSTQTRTACVTVTRASLILALDRARQVVPSRFPKPILTCVRLEASEDLLRIQATDGELSLFTHVPAEGELPACVVPCTELARRLKTSRQGECSLTLSEDGQQLILNGGRVEHALRTLPPEEFPVVPVQYEGDAIEANAAELVRALKVTGVGVAREPGRYALDAVLLESGEEGTRLVATDGRRLVTVELREADELDGKALLPQRFCRLIEKFTARAADFLVLAVQRRPDEKGETLPGRIFAAGPDWLLSGFESEGRFPVYRDVVPRNHSRFAINRTALLETLQEVALAVHEESRMVRVDLYADRVRLMAQAPEVGMSEAGLPAEFLGGSDPEIHTAFNPHFLMDAIKTIESDEIVIDVAQNGYGSDRKVFAKAALLYARHDPSVRWVIMPINPGLEPTRENLGSNYPENLKDEAADAA
jgi:DNA polymerase-3 subunit beta